jgi:NAD(P)-dependent dehydrogenase (short-subunit alcohol dehydrogenase family)
LALEVARHGVTVNAVCPGYTETDMSERAITAIMRGGKSRAEAEQLIAKPSAIGRLLRPEEVANVVVWLCSPEASTVTGEAIVVGG